MPPADSFNRTKFSKFLNRPQGRIFRLAAGTAFLAAGIIFRQHPLGLASLAWSVFPLSAGGLDICYISAALSGPLSGEEIREQYPSA